jgi:hypothetical protein
MRAPRGDDLHALTFAQPYENRKFLDPSFAPAFVRRGGASSLVQFVICSSKAVRLTPTPRAYAMCAPRKPPIVSGGALAAVSRAPSTCCPRRRAM